MELLTALAIGLLFAIGLFQMMRRNVIRSVIGLVIYKSFRVWLVRVFSDWGMRSTCFY